MKIEFKKTKIGFGFTGETQLVFCGKPTTISVVVDTENEITKSQYEVLEHFLLAWNNVNSDIAKAIYEYYRKRENVFNDWFPEGVRINSVEDIIKNICLEGLYIPMQEDSNSNTVYLLLSCSWDNENGIGIQISNNSIIKVDDRSIAF
ncbi:MAG: hypothetical protein K2G70_02930 [Turicibacter sp.]|nr:hypothetical protein [Turicibacter sp.]